MSAATKCFSLFCAGLFAIGASVVFMLVPAGPFDSRNMTGGIVLVVLGGTGIAALGGGVVGGGLGMVFSAPVECCCGDVCC
jgi:hypothetical protein